jgi:hypothetical protein
MGRDRLHEHPKGSSESAAPGSIDRRLDVEEVRFATDSPVEQRGFKPRVPAIAIIRRTAAIVDPRLPEFGDPAGKRIGAGSTAQHNLMSSGKRLARDCKRKNGIRTLGPSQANGQAPSGPSARERGGDGGDEALFKQPIMIESQSGDAAHQLPHVCSPAFPEAPARSEFA